MTAAPKPLGFVVRHAPYARHSPRSQLDVVLAAATLELPLEVFFLGEGIWQLAAGHDPGAAALPVGLKGWGAVSGLTEARIIAEQGALARLIGLGAEPIVPVVALDGRSMADKWRHCGQVMSL